MIRVTEAVRRETGAVVDAALPFGFVAFFVGDPPSGAFQVTRLHALQGAQQRETCSTWIVHAFDSVMRWPDSNPCG
ncbi:hypothetical protein ACIF80_16910 [Streptomyces sp. NPDC085927]|uniref:hypothetical protein n=1 Tax=Streptomyces sp. NPDC085927 TaxID=3365738 RepID=UPI0037CE5373